MRDPLAGISAVVDMLSGEPAKRHAQLAELHRQTTLACLEMYQRPHCPPRPYELEVIGNDFQTSKALRTAITSRRKNNEQRALLKAYARWVGGAIDSRGKRLGGVYGAEDQGCSNVLHILRVAAHFDRAGDEDEAYRLLIWIEQEYRFRVPGVIHDEAEMREVAERASLRLDVLPCSLRRTSRWSQQQTTTPPREEPTQIDLERVFGGDR